MTGVLQCFCEDQKEKGVEDIRDRVFETENGPIQVKERPIQEPICDEYFGDIAWSGYLNQFVGYIIVSFNYVIRVLLIYLIGKIGHPTESQLTQSIKSAVFACQFFNTGILLILTNANREEVDLPIIGTLLNGLYPDFTAKWYNDIGVSLVKTMRFNAFFPIIEFFMWWGMKVGFRILDRSFTCNKNRTKKSTVQQYIDLYAGPAYLMHFKYSTMLNVTFITMMYGVGIPMLYPIAFISIFVLYSVERLCIAYYYK